jgi:hypothetical protein
VGAVCAAYAPVRDFDFVNFDDTRYIVDNPHVRNGITADGIQWAIQSVDEANWFPVTRISEMLDCQLFGLRSGWHHIVNVLFHALAAMLLFAFLETATKARWPSVFVALIFALHPLHVESVAWIAERKDVLCAFFLFLTLWAWVRSRYWTALAAFALGLMSKPMIVTLPFVLLLLDIWPLRRSVRLNDKIPFFVLSAVSAAITYVAQRGSGAVAAIPLATRAGNAIVSYVVYIAKTLWPMRLAVYYPVSVQCAGVASSVGSGGDCGSLGAGDAVASSRESRMALVSDHSRACDRVRAGGLAGAGRPVYVHSDGGASDHRRF